MLNFLKRYGCCVIGDSVGAGVVVGSGVHAGSGVDSSVGCGYCCEGSMMIPSEYSGKM